jgi:DnaJ domain
MAGAASGGSHQDPYRALGVDTGASRQDIARAYRRAVQRTHPDAQPTDPRAAARFQELTDAYDLLCDAARRADYDRRHPAARSSRRPHLPSVQPRPAPADPWAGSPYLLSAAHGPPVRAGPVHVDPPAAAGQQERGGSPADFEDPPVILGLPPGQAWGWLW